jgi:hypothetical protein
MAEKISARFRDGVSQAQRRLQALDPDSIAVDERSLKDWLAFARAFARELRYYDLDNNEAGDWSSFLPDTLNLDEIIAFMQSPESFVTDSPYRQPHRVLLLSFLQLLQQAQARINMLTRRHLEFYYRDVLRLNAKPVQPDSVNVLIQLNDDASPLLLPAGTWLDAGQDSLGQDLVYSTDRDLIVNHAQIAKLSSVYVEKRFTSLRDARENTLGTGEKVIAMLQIALGDPDPGDPLPPYPLNPPERKLEYDQLQIKYDLLVELSKLVGFVKNGLYLELPDFRKLMQAKNKASLTDPKDANWTVVSSLLEQASKTRTASSSFTFNSQQDFATNLNNAISPDFTGLRKAKVIGNIDEYYQAFLDLENYFYLPDRAEDFVFLMETAEKQDASAQDWDKVYAKLNSAYMRKRGRSLPPPVQEEWLNLQAAEDATAISSVSSGDTLRWHTFGQRLPANVKASPPTGTIGWAITSPLLLLGQGTRTVTLFLEFKPEKFDALISKFTTDKSKPELTDLFRIGISTAKGWLEPQPSPDDPIASIAITTADYPGESSLKALKCELTFKEMADPLEPLPAGMSPIESPWPILRLILQACWDDTKNRYITPYPLFRDLELVKVSLQADVQGLRDIQVQNDTTVLDAKSPFEPFGSQPTVGSRCYFGHAELVSKQLDQLSFKIEWMGSPADMATHFMNYPSVTHSFPSTSGANDKLRAIGNKSFTASISLVDRGLDTSLNPMAALFDDKDATAEKTITATKIFSRDLEPISNTEPKTWRRYWQWELNAPDFQHGAYSSVVTAKSLELTAKISANSTPTNDASGNPITPQAIVATKFQVNPPYTPKIKSVSLEYKSTIEIQMNEYRAGMVDRIFHLHPFGYAEVVPDPETKQYRWLPSYDNEGELYIGLRDVVPPQNLSMLLQMAEGSADPEVEPTPVSWSFLNGNRWESLQNGQLISDTTRGLINTGIVEFQLPEVTTSTLLAPELYWLRAAIPSRSAGIADTLTIRTQAVTATFFDQNNAPDHLSHPLPAGTITRFTEPLAAVNRVEQPYSSRGGKPAEQDSDYYTRVSERLRHKQRAVSVWDYEHLILERFPQIYKAKCLPASEMADTTQTPGKITIVVIPDIREQRPFDPFEPKASADLQANIEAYIAEHIPPFASIEVKNAHYLAVKTRFAVRFLPGQDIGFYKRRLNEELNRFLSPWAYEEGADIVIGGKIFANVIIDFIDRRPYVDYVAQFFLFSSEDGQTFTPVPVPGADEAYMIQANRPDCVLVAARQHEIDLIEEARFVEDTFKGINYMKIQLDFKVAEG